MDYKKELEDLGFYVSGKVTFKDGKYSVSGDVRLKTYCTKLPAKFKKVGGTFDCDFGHLITLDGAPEFVGGNFQCRYNELTDLKYAPKKVGGSFKCDCNKIDNLSSPTREVGSAFSCTKNQLKSFGGAPKKILGYFDFGFNSIKNIDDLNNLPEIAGDIYLGLEPKLVKQLKNLINKNRS